MFGGLGGLDRSRGQPGGRVGPLWGRFAGRIDPPRRFRNGRNRAGEGFRNGRQRPVGEGPNVLPTASDACGGASARPGSLGARRCRVWPLSRGRITKQTLLRYARRMGERIERHCVRCGEIFPAQRISARFCGGRCLQQAYLDRHRPPAPPGFGGVLSWPISND